MPISNLTQPTDTVKDYRPSIPKRVKYKPKDRETIIKLPGRKPTVVRSKNEVVKSDNRSNEKKQLDWKHDEQTRARY